MTPTAQLTDAQRVLTLVATVGAGLSAGVFFAFSTFVMPALRRLPASDGLAAMQSVNKLAVNPPFMVTLFGPAVLAVYLTVAMIRRPGRTTAFVVAGAACLLVGLFVTVGYHVPHNDALAAQPAGAGEAWRAYAGPWAAWNHVRTVAFTAATALFTLALASDR